MPECNEIVAMLSDYLDRDLPPDTCTVIREHLASCSKCGEAEASLRRTVDMCRSFRTDSRPGPLPAEKQQELREAFQKVLEDMRSKA